MRPMILGWWRDTSLTPKKILVGEHLWCSQRPVTHRSTRSTHKPVFPWRPHTTVTVKMKTTFVHFFSVCWAKNIAKIARGVHAVVPTGGVGSKRFPHFWGGKWRGLTWPIPSCFSKKSEKNEVWCVESTLKNHPFFLFLKNILNIFYGEWWTLFYFFLKNKIKFSWIGKMMEWCGVGTNVLHRHNSVVPGFVEFTPDFGIKKSGREIFWDELGLCLEDLWNFWVLWFFCNHKILEKWWWCCDVVTMVSEDFFLGRIMQNCFVEHDVRCCVGMFWNDGTVRNGFVFFLEMESLGSIGISVIDRGDQHGGWWICGCYSRYMYTPRSLRLIFVIFLDFLREIIKFGWRF